jgi:hypothetical protein
MRSFLYSARLDESEISFFDIYPILAIPSSLVRALKDAPINLPHRGAHHPKEWDCLADTFKNTF